MTQMYWRMVAGTVILVLAGSSLAPAEENKTNCCESAHAGKCCSDQGGQCCSEKKETCCPQCVEKCPGSCCPNCCQKKPKSPAGVRKEVNGSRLIEKIYSVADLLEEEGMTCQQCAAWEKWLVEGVNPSPGRFESLEKTLVQLVTKKVEPQSWSAQGGPGTISYFALGKAVIVNQPPEVQKQVQKFLSGLRDCKEQELTRAVVPTSTACSPCPHEITQQATPDWLCFVRQCLDQTVTNVSNTWSGLQDHLTKHVGYGTQVQGHALRMVPFYSGFPNGSAMVTFGPSSSQMIWVPPFVFENSVQESCSTMPFAPPPLYAVPPSERQDEKEGKEVLVQPITQWAPEPNSATTIPVEPSPLVDCYLPTVVPCACTTPAKAVVPTLTLKVVNEEGHDKLEISNGPDACLTCDHLVLKVKDGCNLKVFARENRLHIHCSCMKASAERLTRTGPDHIVLEGKVHLDCTKCGESAGVTAEKVTLNLTNGEIDIKVNAGRDVIPVRGYRSAGIPDGTMWRSNSAN